MSEEKPRTENFRGYQVLSKEEVAKGYVRPYRDAYVHRVCGTKTTMHKKLAETYACRPKFYSETMCVHCGEHFPVGEFVWDGTKDKVGS